MTTYPPPPPPPPTPYRTAATADNGLHSKLAVGFYLVIFLNIFFFAAVFINDSRLHDELTREDGWAEYLTAVAFFLAGLVTAATAYMERSWTLRSFYFLGAVAMLFVAGEEISWGQRLFEWETPDFMMSLNQQGESNLHNIETEWFGELGNRVTAFLCAVTAIAICLRQNRLFGIPLPSLPLLLGILSAQIYYLSLFDSQFAFEYLLLLLLGVFGLISRRPWWLVMVAAPLILNQAIAHIYAVNNIRSVHYDPHEVYEYLRGLVCLFYAFELLLAQRRSVTQLPPQGTVSSSPIAAKRSPIAYVPLWLAASALVIVGSLGLAGWKQVEDRAEAAEFERALQSIASGESEPLVRSHFDFHIVGNRLVYRRDECASIDASRDLNMSIQIIPVDTDDLPHGTDGSEYVREYLYEGYNKELADQHCMSTIVLPSYPIARINIIQTERDENRKWQQVREASFFHPDYASALSRKLEKTVGSPSSYTSIISDSFEVLFDSEERELLYLRQPCVDFDVDAWFFLHVFPFDSDDLPSHRKGYTFDNLDFKFDERGVMEDDKCTVWRALPDYDIARIRTGQYTGDVQLWNGEAALP